MTGWGKNGPAHSFRGEKNDCAEITPALWVCPVNETLICPCQVIGTLQYWSEPEKLFEKVKKIFRQTNKA